MQTFLLNLEKTAPKILEAVVEGVLIASVKSHVIVYANPAACSLFDYEPQEILGLENWFLHPEEAHDEVRRHFDSQVRNEKNLATDVPCLKKGGGVFWCDVKSVPFSQDGQEYLVGFFSDVTELKKSKAHRLQVENILGAVQDGLWENDFQNNNFWFSDRIFTMLGYAPLQGQEAFDFLFSKVDPDDAAKLMGTYERVRLGPENEYTVEIRIRDIHNQVRWIMTRGHCIGRNAQGVGVQFLGTHSDITEKQKMMDAMLKTQKLESLGILAGGIAHDFNNLLGGIYGSLELAGMMETVEEVRPLLDLARGTMDRARGLTRQLLTYSKGGEPVKSRCDLGPLLTTTVGFALSGSPLSLTWNLSPDLWKCEVDAAQIGQVLDNLVINAKQALGESGRLEIRGTNVEDVSLLPSILSPGLYVKVDVIDSGPGIPLKYINQIFDPFFTTKAGGSGLGLSTSLSILTRHGGTLEVHSEEGRGSTFSLYLPASLHEKDENRAPKDSQEVREPQTFYSSGNPLAVYVLEDQEVMQRTLNRMLSALGYRAIIMSRGEDLLRSMETHKPSALLLDLTISGGMGGLEVCKQARASGYEAPIWVMSGYTNDPAMVSPHSHGFTSSLQKPFTFDSLRALLKFS